MSKKDYKGRSTAANDASAAGASAASAFSAVPVVIDAKHKAETVKFLEKVDGLSASLDQKAFAPQGKEALGYFLSNDNFSTLDLAAEFKKINKVANAINIGIIIGEGHFISLLPELSQFLDGIIFLDMNPKGLAHLQLLLKILNISSSIKEFIGKYCKAIKEELGLPDGSSADLLFQSQHRLVGKDFFLSDEKRFQQCKKHAAEMPVAYFCADFLNLDYMQKLVALLDAAQAQVQWLNITNLFDWDPSDEKVKLQQVLDIFKKFNPQVVYSYSYEDFRENGCTTFLTRVLDVKEMQEMITQSAPAEFEPPSISEVLNQVSAMNRWAENLHQDQNFDPNVFLNQMRQMIASQMAMLSLQNRVRGSTAALPFSGQNTLVAPKVKKNPVEDAAATVAENDKFFAELFK